MKKNQKLSLIIVLCLLLGNIISIFLYYNISFENSKSINKFNEKLKPITSGFYGLTPFIIDDTGAGDYTWSQAALEEWCSGAGTWNNPYIIENVSINGQDSSNCIEIRNSDVYFQIINCTFTNSNYGSFENSGIYLRDVNNGTISSNNCSNNRGNGIFLYSCSNMTIAQNLMSDNEHFGLQVVQSSNNSILQNNVFRNDPYGMVVSASNYIIINNNTIADNDVDGIFLVGTNSSKIIRNDVKNHHTGISLSDSHRNQILQNHAYSNQYGIYLQGNSPGSNKNIIASNNLNLNSFNGIYLYNSDSSVICNNSIEENGWGIGLFSNSYNNTFFSNKLMNNVESQSIDDGINNLWDNGSIGNYWSNYEEINPTATNNEIMWDTPYLIDGTSGSVDRFPLVIPGSLIPLSITHPNDISYEYNTVGNEISWTITDKSVNNPTYVIYKNNNELINQSWTSGVPITMSIDGLNIGFYNYTINIVDGLGEGIEDQVIISVENYIPTLLNPPTSINYEYSATGNEISWTITDNSVNNPTYVIHRNDNELINQYWTPGVPITINIDGLDVGFYNYTIIISDGLGEIVSDDVIVIVSQPSVDGFQPPITDFLPIIILALISAVILIGSIGFYLARNKKKKRSYKQKIEEKDIKEILEVEEIMSFSKTLEEKIKDQKIEMKRPEVTIELQSKILEIEKLINNMKYADAKLELKAIKKDADLYKLEDIVKWIDKNLVLCDERTIKKTIIDLGTKFTRLEIVEIVEKTGIDDDSLIIKTVSDMIENKEIYAEYFSSSKVVAFNQQAIINDIDKLMNTYKEGKGKKGGDNHGKKS